MKRLLTALAFLVLFSLPAFADTIVYPGGQGPTGTTCTLIAVPAASTKVTLTAPSSYITIVNTSAVATLYFNTVSPATTSNFPILPNSAYSYSGQPLSSFWVIGSAADSNFGVVAH